MARRREFDYERALERATRLFWSQGFTNTSLRALLAAMEVGEGSFYNVFKGKRDLYLACLEHYNTTVTRRRAGIFAAEPSVRQAVRKFFETVIEEIHDPSVPPSCLMANSLFADVLVDPLLGRAVLKEMKTFTAALEKRLAAGVEAGELPRDFPVRATTQVLITFLQGLFRVSGGLNGKKELRKQVDALLAGLGFEGK